MFDSIDDIDADSVFNDEFDDEENEDDDDDIFSNINEDELGFEEPEDDIDEDFLSDNNDNDSIKANKVQQNRYKAPNKVFLNGTKRGEQTQQIFNILDNMISGTGKLFSKSAKKSVTVAKKGVNSGINKINHSSLFNLDDN